MFKFYDSDILSDAPVNIFSDSEPPKDIVHERKLIKKEKFRRIHKEIWQVGKTINKPAKYDEIKIQWQKINDPQAENALEQFKESQVFTLNIGLNQQDEWWNDIVENMKQGEISLIYIEKLKLDQNQMKILDYTENYFFHLISWITIIDLNQDFNYMKKIIQKGEGIDRCEACDEIAFSYTVKRNETILLTKEHTEPVYMKNILDDNENGCPSTVWRVLKSMKYKEQCVCTINSQTFMQDEKNQFILKQIESVQQELQNKQEETKQNEQQQQIEEEKAEKGDKEISQKNQTKQTFTVEVQVNQLIKVDDIFNDYTALKREIKRGFITSKPDKISRIYFDLKIIVGNERLYQSNEKFIYQEKSKTDINQLEKESNCLKYFLDDYKLSKLLRNVLKKMKKGQICEIECKDKNLVKYGFDHDIMIQKLGNIPDTFKYLIIVYDFTEGKNTFNMSIDEKIEQSLRKKQIGLQMIKENNYKKALKTFESINAYFELGNFYAEDKVHVYQHRLSSYLNTSLCHMKLCNWDKLIMVCGKILELDPKNPKAIFRKSIGLKEKQEYKEALDLTTGYLKENEQALDQDYRNEIKKLQEELDHLYNKYMNQQKSVYSKMFQ